jgi:hypothetical protein
MLRPHVVVCAILPCLKLQRVPSFGVLRNLKHVALSAPQTCCAFLWSPQEARRLERAVIEGLFGCSSLQPLKSSRSERKGLAHLH